MPAFSPVAGDEALMPWRARDTGVQATQEMTDSSFSIKKHAKGTLSLKKREAQSHRHVLPKSPTSIQGLDELRRGIAERQADPCLRRRWLRKDPLCRSFSFAGQRQYDDRGLHIIRGDRGRTHSKRRFVGFRSGQPCRAQKIWLEHITLNGMKRTKW